MDELQVIVDSRVPEGVVAFVSFRWEDPEFGEPTIDGDKMTFPITWTPMVKVEVMRGVAHA
jgi:hypothetical protein